MNMHGASEFIKNYPSMSYGPIKAHGFSLTGKFSFVGHYQGLPSIEDGYELEIVVPDDFPYTSNGSGERRGNSQKW